jgi:hypothetical protein
MQQHWEGYMKALGAQKLPNTTMPETAPYETSSSETGKSGFMDLLVSRPQIQARYDAMQGTWEGPAAADAAISQGMFKAESMPVEQKQTTNKK